MLSSSRDALLKLFKTTSSQKLFPFDCITLYNIYIYVLKIAGKNSASLHFFFDDLELGSEVKLVPWTAASTDAEKCRQSLAPLYCFKTNQ